jgi:hypothetical protein
MIAEVTRARQEGDEAAHAQIVGEVEHAQLNLFIWSVAMEKSNQLIVVLLKFAPDCFHDSVVLDGLSKMLLCLLDMYANHTDLVSAENIRDGHSNYLRLLMSLVRITNAIIQAVVIDAANQVLLDRLVENKMFPAAPIVEKLQTILCTKEMLLGDMAAHFNHFVRAIRDTTRDFSTHEIDFDDAPEEFLDPLTYELMKDPLKLPSGNIMDRDILKKSMLGMPVDPFTMQSLKLEDCEPQPELKRRIDEWKAEKLAERRCRGS